MRFTSPDPLGRGILSGVGAVAVAAAVLVPTVAGHRDHRAAPHRTPGAVAVAPDGITAPLPNEWLQLRARAKRHHRPAAAASPPKNEARPLPTVGGAIPPRVLRAYVHAAQASDRALPSCHLAWNVLAGIGFIESGHAASGGSASTGWKGLAQPPIYGPLLDGHNRWNAFADTDGGRLDGNRLWDRAVGPMQFMPSTWQLWGADGNGDGKANPQQIDDAALASAHYLCAAADHLDQPSALHRAIFAYNHDKAYVRAVLTIAANYAGIDPAKYGVTSPPKHKKRHRHVRVKHRRARHGSSTSRPSVSVSPTPATVVASGTAAPGSTPSPDQTPSPQSTEPTPTPTPTDSASGTPTDSPAPAASPSPTG